jgi:hypothetical protein
MIESKRILRMWITASLLWLAILGFFLTNDWQKIGPPSAECADFVKHHVGGSLRRPLTEHEVTCVTEAISPNAQLMANILKLAIFPPALVLAAGWLIRVWATKKRGRPEAV